jgi:hypothetical protein
MLDKRIAVCSNPAPCLPPPTHMGSQGPVPKTQRPLGTLATGSGDLCRVLAGGFFFLGGSLKGAGGGRVKLLAARGARWRGSWSPVHVDNPQTRSPLLLAATFCKGSDGPKVLPRARWLATAFSSCLACARRESRSRQRGPVSRRCRESPCVLRAMPPRVSVDGLADSLASAQAGGFPFVLDSFVF